MAFAAKKSALESFERVEVRANALSSQLRNLRSMLATDRMRGEDLCNVLGVYDALVRLEEQESVMAAVEKCRVAISELREAESKELEFLLTRTGLGAVLAARAMRGDK